jgi:hypothetical protein
MDQDDSCCYSYIDSVVLMGAPYDAGGREYESPSALYVFNILSWNIEWK